MFIHLVGKSAPIWPLIKAVSLKMSPTRYHAKVGFFHIASSAVAKRIYKTTSWIAYPIQGHGIVWCHSESVITLEQQLPSWLHKRVQNSAAEQLFCMWKVLPNLRYSQLKRISADLAKTSVMSLKSHRKQYWMGESLNSFSPIEDKARS